MYLKRANGIQFLSSDLYNYIKNLSIDSEKTFTITRGVDINIFKPADHSDLKIELGFKKDDIIILYVGRLDLVKGVTYLLEAAKEIVPKYNNVKFLIVGDGGLKKEFESEVVLITKNITFLRA